MRQAGEIEYVLDHAGSVSVRIHDVAGRLVRTLQDGWQTAGAHRIVWDGSDDAGRTAPGGVYFYRLEAGGESSQRRLTRLR
jgi:flagellar hook assembly protein FlgD